MEKQLFDVAWKDLSKKCRPQYQYSSTLSNVLTIPQFKGFLKYFQLGNFIRMATDYDTIIKLRLISFTVDYNDTSKIDVTFSDAIRVHDIYEDASSIQAQANSAAMSFKFNKNQYDKSVNQSNFVEEMRKYGLDVANIPVKNQHQSWDETGMWFRQWNEQKNDFDPEQIKIINNQIVFSDDGFQSTKMAIGKIPIDKNGNTVYAVNAEAILGKLFLGEYLTLQNNSGTYKFDDAGFIAKSGNNSVRIQPNQSGELFSIYKGNNKQFYVDSDGNVHFTGDLTGSSGTFSGNISGGSINLGNGTFTVDENGNMYASSARISGEVNASSGTIGGWNIGTNSLYRNYVSTTIGYINTTLSPAGLTFDILNQSDTQSDTQRDTMIINPLNIGWDTGDGEIRSLIGRTSITTPKLSTSELNFVLSSNPKIKCPSGYITFETTNNVHFYNTPYIDVHQSYLAREKWCYENFALISSLSSYLTKSDAKSSYLTKSDASKYTTNSEVRSIVRSMVKSKYLN